MRKILILLLVAVVLGWSVAVIGAMYKNRGFVAGCDAYDLMTGQDVPCWTPSFGELFVSFDEIVRAYKR